MLGASILWVLPVASWGLGLALLTASRDAGGGVQHGQPSDGAVSRSVPLPQ